MNIASLTSTSSSIDSLISQYMAIERRPIIALQGKRGDLNVQLGVFNDLSGKLSSLQGLADDLADTESSVFQQYTATSSDETYLTATASTTASVGTYSIGVNTLATQHIVASDTDNSGGTGGTFTIQDGLNTLTVTLSDGYTLQDVVDAINTAADDAGSNIQASIVDSKLIISGEYGASNTMAFDDTSGTVLEDLGVIVDAGNAVKNKLQDASDASFTVNGLTVTRSTNEDIDDVIEGVTLNLLQVTTSNVTLQVQRDTSAITSQIESFLSQFNDTIGYIQTKTSVNTTTYSRGPLAGESSVMALRTRLINALLDSVSSVQAGNPETLAEIGITFDDDGEVSISDSETFSDYLANNPTAVEDLFNSTDGVANTVSDLLDSFTQTDGILENRTDSIDDRIEYINDRIERLEARMTRREQQLRSEFASMQQALNLVVAQQSFLNAFLMNFGGYTSSSA